LEAPPELENDGVEAGALEHAARLNRSNSFKRMRMRDPRRKVMSACVAANKHWLIT
jgi:hypothetical protein